MEMCFQIVLLAGVLLVFWRLKKEVLWEKEVKKTVLLGNLLLSVVLAVLPGLPAGVPLYFVGGLLPAVVCDVGAGILVTEVLALLHLCVIAPEINLVLFLLEGMIFSMLAVWLREKKSIPRVLLSAEIIAAVLTLMANKFRLHEACRKELFWQLTGTLLLFGMVLLGVHFCTRKRAQEASYDSDLLKRLEAELPKVYEHSVRVAELSAKAAEAVEADAKLCRAAGLYHEIGRLEQNKEYITEGLRLLEAQKLPMRLLEVVRQTGNKSEAPKSPEAAILRLTESILTTLEFLRQNGTMVSADKLIESNLRVPLMKGMLDESALSIKDYTTLKRFYLSEMSKETTKSDMQK
ncbi:MAG: HDIG domain-containing protein [Lachnospiraceae bacterium]|nr:HDIG domain-containing protein [Lachnospiraceae bacterium]